jgi:hypothetical protein
MSSDSFRYTECPSSRPEADQAYVRLSSLTPRLFRPGPKPIQAVLGTNHVKKNARAHQVRKKLVGS